MLSHELPSDARLIQGSLFPESGIEQSGITQLNAIATEVRRSAFEVVQHANSGHLGASSSSAELLTALYFGGILNYEVDDPRHAQRDRVLIRGHLGPARYTIFSMLGWIEPEQLSRYRQLHGLPGHEEMDLVPGADLTPSGSLGMELSYGAGAALAAKNRGDAFKTYVFLGDGEEQEGNVSEAARHVAALRLTNLVCIMDRNGKQLSRSTQTADGSTDIKKTWEGYGWNVIEIENGNNMEQVVTTLKRVKENSVRSERPTLVIAKTTKGLGIPGAEQNFSGYHTIGSISADTLQQAITDQTDKLHELGYTSSEAWTLARSLASDRHLPATVEEPPSPFHVNIQPDPNNSTSIMKSLESYRQQLALLFRQETTKRLYSMTADLMKTPLVDLYGFHCPIQHIDVGIREQHLFAMAYGLSLTDLNSRVLINSADLTLYREADQLNSIAIGGAPMVILGEGGGLSGSRDGLTHETTGQPGVLLTMPGMKFLEPADVQDAYNCLNESLSTYDVPTYIRTHARTVEPLLRAEKDRYSTTYYEVEPSEQKPDVILVSAGLATQGGLEAKRMLVEQGINAKLINVVDLKSLDRDFAKLVDEGVPILTLYNGNEFVLRSAVTAALTSTRREKSIFVAGHGFVRGASGTLEDLIAYYRLDGSGIVSVVQERSPEVF